MIWRPEEEKNIEKREEEKREVDLFE